MKGKGKSVRDEEKKEMGWRILENILKKIGGRGENIQI